MAEREQVKGVSPSKFMRELRPEFYSDTSDRTAYQLDASALEYHLDSITSRNQTHDFEIFCRKLCERTICPNLKPATGPEGGGDSKADSETIPIADEIATLTYMGDANAAQERWAFAFSAKRKWTEKVRNDVAGIVATQRGYQKVYCVTAQFARAKDRARVEDELSKQYGVTITILDRSWIVDQVVSNDRKDLAFNYLGVGQEVAGSRRMGPTDYSRSQQLEDIEKTLGNPEAFSGMKMQRVTESLVAAKLSRNLELPRIETDGRFARAIRLAEQDGTYRQKLEAHYESIWTAFWWFDDIAYLNGRYDEFANLVSDTDHAINLEFLCNLVQLLFNSVIHQHLTVEEARLEERASRLTERLKVIAENKERPNNALEALSSLLVIEVNQAILKQDTEKLSSLWPQFSDVVKRARGLGEFSAERLTKMIEVFGLVAGKDSSYVQLVDEVAAFVSERTGEAQGALVLLKRAQQLDFEDNFEIIRLLGKAARQLTKKEYADSLIEALQLLTFAYRSAGLLWAARATCIFAMASMFIEAEEDSDLSASIVPMVMALAWIAVELRHLPDALEAVRLVRGCTAMLPLDDSSKDRIAKRLTELDLILASQILNFTAEELQHVVRLPDVLGGLGLQQSRNSLIYALGHEAELRREGSIPQEETPEKVAELFTLLASQPVSSNQHGPVIFNEADSQCLVSRVQGIRVAVFHPCSDALVLAAEAVIGSVEAFFATAIESGAVAHTENFTISLQDSSEVLAPDYTINTDEMTAIVRWPTGFKPATFARQADIQKMLIGLAAEIFAATCYVEDMRKTIEHLFSSEAVLDRISMVVIVGNSRQRVFKEGLSKLSDWTQMAISEFTLESSRPVIIRRLLNTVEDQERCSTVGKRSSPPLTSDHRDLGVRSVIDVHLWDQAGWNGTAFTHWGPSYPPAIALMFKHEDAARKIFSRWRQRLGTVDKQDEIYLAILRGISVDEPAHYRVLITSRLSNDEGETSGKTFMMASRMQTMHAETDVNLIRFLNIYRQSRAYLLLPAIFNGRAEPKFIPELAILKRELSVKNAIEVNEHDVEVMALGAEEYRRRFGTSGPGNRS
ncbi:tetratricopeptide repeat protein [Escherichia coli]|nr:tetratricopeptide repeat protein [Escherichia coli]EKC5838200.1 tetratricopeptide repeat protein [Salmonella enterica]